MGISPALIGGGMSLAGGLLQGNSASNAAGASAQGMVEAARIAAEAAKFRPVGITTRFGSSNFQFDPNTGYLTGAGYNVSPELKGYQDTLSAMQGRQLGEAANAYQQYQPLQGAASGLFNLGQQYLAQSPEQVAQQYMAKQQDLLAPSRERQYSQLQNQLFNTGRGGLSVGATGMRPSGSQGLGATTPEMEAYYNAMAQQDAQLAAQAQQAGQQQVAFGAGLFGTGANLLGSYQQGQVGALSPFQTSLGVQSGIEQLGQQPLTLGAGLGGQAAAYGANAGRFLYGGGMGAAGTMQEANAYNPYASALINASTNRQLQQGIGNFLNNQTQYTPQQFQQQQVATYGSANAGFGGTGGFFD